MKTFAIAAAVAATLVSVPLAQAAVYSDGGSAASEALGTQSYPMSAYDSYGTTYTGRSAAMDDASGAFPDSHVIGSGDRHGTASGGPVGGFKSQP